MTAPAIQRPRTDLPPDMAALIREAEQRGYQQGHGAGIRDCVLHPELLDVFDHDWRREATAARREALRRADEWTQWREDERRRTDNEAAGRHPGYQYRGGAVDWMTGLPAGSWCARLRWMRRQGLATVTALPTQATAVRREAA